MIRSFVNRLASPKPQRGGTLIEVLVAMGLAAILLPALATAVITSREGRAQDQQRLQATALQREAAEALYSIRSAAWSNLAANGTYFPAISGSNWTLTSGTETANGFTRSIVISDVQRASATGAIVASGGTVDPSTKKATINVGWSTPVPTTITTELYLQRRLANTAWTQTTQANFDAGTKTNVTTTTTSGGEVQLTSVPGSPGWETPSIAGSYDAAGTENPNDVFVLGDYAYVADATILRIINISNPASPVLAGSYTVSGTIFGVHVDGSYAYLATGHNTQELMVVNVSNPASPTLAGSRDLGDSNDATAIFALGGYAYVGKVNSTTANINEFYVINVSTPTNPTISGSLNVAGNVSGIHATGTTAYLATSVDTAELTIVNVATPASPAQSGVYNAAGTANGQDVFAVGTTAYLAVASNSTNPELFIINAATPAAPALVGSYNTSSAITGVSVSGTFAFLATSVTNQQLVILDISAPASPTTESIMNLAALSNKLYVYEDLVYVASQHDTRELTIIRGAATAGGFQSSGMLESSSFDAGANAGFNYLAFTATGPANTNVQIQIATNTNNSTWNYVGPDGTAATYYTAGGAIPLGAVSGRYARYKATLTGNGSATPVLQDVSVNYSP